MSVAACAALVERGDPERFRAAMAAPVAARPVLFALAAFNVEVSRAPWVTQEAMIAEMRLQWWRDALDEIASGGPVRRHEVVDALADVLDPEGVQAMDGLVAARRWDIYRDPFEDRGHFDAYLDSTSGSLMWTGARLLGVADEAVVRNLGWAAGLAGFLRAIPALEDAGRVPLLDGTPEAVAALARDGLARLDRARAGRKAVSVDAAPALLAGWAARPVLAQAAASPARVAKGRLAPGPLRLAQVGLLGWWR